MRVCVFCGSNPGARPAYVDAAVAVGSALGGRGWGLVYGGGEVGLMGRVANACLAAGGQVVGVIPDFLLAREVGHPELAELRVVTSMHERKTQMSELADGFLALPGGLGTLEELCEILTWAQLGLHRKPVVVLDVDGFYEPFFVQLDRAREEGFLKPPYRALAQRASSVEEALELLAQPAPDVSSVEKWTDRPVDLDAT